MSVHGNHALSDYSPTTTLPVPVTEINSVERNATPLGSALRSLAHNLSRLFSYCLLHDRLTKGCAIASSDFREPGIP
jgi:hypothetical protein